MINQTVINHQYHFNKEKIKDRLHGRRKFPYLTAIIFYSSSSPNLASFDGPPLESHKFQHRTAKPNSRLFA